MGYMSKGSGYAPLWGRQVMRFHRLLALVLFATLCSFELSKKYHVNLRADIAQDKDGHTFGMGVGEAF